MPDKHYVVLYRVRREEMTFPVKGERNQLDNSVQFAGGYPAIFGGTDQGGGVDKTLDAEVREESRQTLRPTTPLTFAHYFTGQRPHNDLHFYWTANWETTGTQWRPPTTRDEGEMAKIATVSLESFSSQDPPNLILDKLIKASGAPGGTTNQKQEFFTSETAAAFVQFIYNNVNDE